MLIRTVSGAFSDRGSGEASVILFTTRPTNGATSRVREVAPSVSGGRVDGSATPHSAQSSSRGARSAARISGLAKGASDPVAASAHRR